MKKMYIVKCLLCKASTEYLCNYKFNVETDINFFGKMQLFYCKKCDLAFTNPMPPLKKLNEFYSHTYRNLGRPHYTNFDLAEKNLLSQKNMNYINYLSTFIDFNKINSIFDFGSGSGDIGFLLRQKFRHLKLYTIENDIFAKKILRERNYKIYNNFKEINIKFDLIISIHVLEHLTNFKSLQRLKSLLKKNCLLFFEVPNNLFKINFLKRPYDSPHLIFFSQKTFQRIKLIFKLEIVNLTYSFFSINKLHTYMQETKSIYGKWSLKNKNKLFIKMYIRKILQKIYSIIMGWRGGSNNCNYNLSSENFINGDSNSWCLRVLYKNR
jgi:2-polyprenyl-3-methyl-5-hydroxy-6-metoxy-1,4-benzoquinol methylase